jgi:hypothetical protein
MALAVLCGFFDEALMVAFQFMQLAGEPSRVAPKPAISSWLRWRTRRVHSRETSVRNRRAKRESESVLVSAGPGEE